MATDSDPFEKQLSELSVPPVVREAVQDYYHRYEEFYAEPWRQLDETRRLYESADTEHRMAMLTLSYVYAVVSQRVAIDLAEEHFRLFYDGMNLQEMLIQEGNINGKADWMYGTLDEFGRDGLAEIADMLADGRVEKAVRIMEDDPEFKGISEIKAPFVASQLGYTSQMCIDANMQSFLGLDFSGITVSGEQVDKVCASVMDLFPELASEVGEAYHLQWILFNFERVNDAMWEPDTNDLTLTITGDLAVEEIEGREPEQHDDWFRAVLDDRERVVDRVDALFAEARGG